MGAKPFFQKTAFLIKYHTKGRMKLIWGNEKIENLPTNVLEYGIFNYRRST